LSGTRTALLWSLAERYLGVAIGLAASMVLARLLTPAQVGMFSLCAALLMVAATIREFGVSEYIIQEKALDDHKLRQAYGVAILTAWPVGAIVFLIRQPVADYYRQPELAGIIGVLALNYLLLPLATPAYAILVRELRFRLILFVHLANALLGAAAAIALAHAGFGAISLAWGAVASTAAQLIGVTIVRPRSSMLLPSFSGLGQIMKFGGTLVSARILETTTNSAHEFFIAHQFGFTAVGLFSRAKGMVDMFTSTITTAVARVATPDMAAALRENRSLVHTFSRGTAIFTVVAWTFFGYVALTAGEIIRVLFGPQWDDAARIGSLLAVAMLPSALFALSGSVVAATGEVKRRMSIALRWCPVHLVVVVVGCQLGLYWVAGLWLVTNVVIAAAHAQQLHQLLGVPYRQLYGPSLASVPVVLVSVAAWWARGQGVPALPLLVLVLAVGLAAWAAAVVLLRHPVQAEIHKLLALIRHRRAGS
jgi:O-antigen/teichoic acid export membrane protein